MIVGNLEKDAMRLLEQLDRREKLTIYAIAVAALLVVALLAVALEPRPSNGLSRCMDIVLSQNRYSCLYALAASTGNASVCGGIAPASSDYCYAEVALATRNTAACSGISTSAGKYQCVEMVANASDSYVACGALNGSQESGCIEALALKLDSVVGCSGIPNATDALVCANAVNIANARSTGNPGYCAGVSDTANQSFVYGVVTLSGEVHANASQSAGLSFIDPVQYLENAGEAYSARDLCYLSATSTSGNTSSCSSIANASLQGLCVAYKQAAAPSPANLSSANVTSLRGVCSQYTGADLQSCYALTDVISAVSGRNASVCSGINGTADQNQCYYALARAYNDTAYCGYIQNSTYNQACVQDINYNFT